MAVRYFYNNEQILHIKNSTFETFYLCLLEVMEENQVCPNQNIAKLIEHLEQGGYGIGVDISKYLKSKNDLLVFAELIKKAIEKFEINVPTLREDVKRTFWDFHKELYKKL